MSYKAGSFTQVGTGTATIAIGFQPSLLRFSLSQLNGTQENSVAHMSTGFTDGIQQYTHSILAMNGGFWTRFNDTFCVAHYAIVSNAFTRVISAEIVSFNPTSFTLNFDRASSAYLITFEAQS